MKIFLSGFMGAGKTSTGRALAIRLGLPFADLDEEIEKRTGLSVRELFERFGEPEFRRLERAVLDELVKRPDLVVALGGGTLIDRDARAGVGAHGVVVWLHPPFAEIVRRIGALGKNDRPLFRDEAQALELYRQRLPSYQLADLRLDVAAGESCDEVAARLALRLAGAACSS